MVFVDIAKIQSIGAFVVAELTFLLFMISEREGVIFSLCIMENFVNAFDREFDSMNEGVGLFAEAMAHLIDKESNEFVLALGDENCASANVAAESSDFYV